MNYRSFKENYELYENMYINLTDLEIAVAVKEQICSKELTDEEFEKICQKIRNVYLASDNLVPDDIAFCINEMFDNNDTVEYVLQMDEYDLLDKSSYYHN